MRGVSLAILVLVIIVGVIALVGIINTTTGALVEEIRYDCKCTIEQFDFYGKGIGREVHKFDDRRRFLSVDTQRCNEACRNKYQVSDSDTIVFGELKPFAHLRPRRPYHEPRVMPSRI